MVAIGRPPRPFESFFVKQSGGCWEWHGQKAFFGYGRIKRHGRRVLAHRAAWELYRGPIPPGMCVLHSCDNPPCVNPDHLFLGTHADNAADRTAKGRGGRSPGESNGCAKLTADDVASLRKRRVAGEKLADLAATFGVSQTTVSQIANGHRWR